METVEIFLSEFLPAFVGITLGMTLGCLFCRWSGSPYPYPFSLGPSSFAELSAFSDDERRRLLREATRKAFPRRSWLTAIVIFAAVIAFGIALARVLRTVGVLPDSVWTSASLSGAFTGLALLLLRTLRIRHVRPFLRRAIEKPRNGA
jgi:hypothetical protein